MQGSIHWSALGVVLLLVLLVLATLQTLIWPSPKPFPASMHDLHPADRLDLDEIIQRLTFINSFGFEMMFTPIIMCQAPRAEVVLVLSRSRSVTPADRGNYDLIEAGYNYINSSRPPKILESPLDSKSLMAGGFLLPTRGAHSDI